MTDSDHVVVDVVYQLVPAAFNLSLAADAPAGTEVRISGDDSYSQVFTQSTTAPVDTAHGEYRILVSTPVGYSATVDSFNVNINPDGYFVLDTSYSYPVRGGITLPVEITVEVSPAGN